jgi:ABC-type amino acid transport system permease subunit
MSLFASFIGVNDIFRIAQQLNASTYATVEIYTIIGVIFFIVSMLMNLVITYLKNKFNYAYS